MVHDRHMDQKNIKIDGKIKISCSIFNFNFFIDLDNVIQINKQVDPTLFNIVHIYLCKVILLISTHIKFRATCIL